MKTEQCCNNNASQKRDREYNISSKDRVIYDFNREAKIRSKNLIGSDLLKQLKFFDKNEAKIVDLANSGSESCQGEQKSIGSASMASLKAKHKSA